MRRCLALSILVLGFIDGCASYKPSSAPVPEAGAMPAWRTEGIAAAGADPYVQPDRQKGVFDADLNDAGVLPIQLLVQNEGDRGMLVRPSDIRLVLPDGRQIGPVGTAAVVAKLEKPSMHFWPTFFLGLPGALVSMSASDKARGDRQGDYRSKEFRDATLRKGQSAHGFVYFIPPAGTPAFTEATLTVRCVDTEEATSFVVSLPLTGLDFKGVPAQAEVKEETSAEAGSPSQSPGKEGDPTQITDER